VVGRAGLTQSAADLLRTSDFLTRLLFSHDDRSHDPVVLAIAMTHVDNVAHSAWEKDKSRRRAVHLAEQFDAARALLRSQLAQQLEAVWDADQGGSATAKRDVIQRLCEEALIFPVSAPEYRRVLADEDDDRPFIKDLAESGIPTMQDGLKATVAQR